MKITLIGYGKMGKMVEQAATNAGHTICSIIDPTELGNCIDASTLKNTDVCIDFTHPSKVVNNIEQVINYGKPMVVGTTGWEEHTDMVRKWVLKKGTGLLYGPNFSIGINLFLKILQKSVEMLCDKQYDVAGLEIHHNKKADAPSGTAKEIINLIALATNQEKEKISFSSVRCGSVPGTHKVIFDSPFDTITLTHEARNREGFATGAILAAEWIKNKNGLYHFNDIFKD